MDIGSLVNVCSVVCKKEVQCHELPDDPYLEVLPAFDILKKKRVFPWVTLDFIYIEAYCLSEPLIDEFDEDIASFAACILAGSIQRDYMFASPYQLEASCAYVEKRRPVH